MDSTNWVTQYDLDPNQQNKDINPNLEYLKIKTDSTKALSFCSSDYNSENKKYAKMLVEYKFKNDYLKNKNELLHEKITYMNKS